MVTKFLTFIFKNNRTQEIEFKAEDAEQLIQNFETNQRYLCKGIDCDECLNRINSCADLMTSNIKSVVYTRPTENKSETPDIYKMELHEELPNIGGFVVTRVPGGWIYTDSDSSTFVPFNNEFMPKDQQQ